MLARLLIESSRPVPMQLGLSKIGSSFGTVLFAFALCRGSVPEPIPRHGQFFLFLALCGLQFGLGYLDVLLSLMNRQSLQGLRQLPKYRLHGRRPYQMPRVGRMGCNHGCRSHGVEGDGA